MSQNFLHQDGTSGTDSRDSPNFFRKSVVTEAYLSLARTMGRASHRTKPERWELIWGHGIVFQVVNLLLKGSLGWYPSLFQLFTVIPCFQRICLLVFWNYSLVILYNIFDHIYLVHPPPTPYGHTPRFHTHLPSFMHLSFFYCFQLVNLISVSYMGTGLGLFAGAWATFQG